MARAVLLQLRAHGALVAAAAVGAAALLMMAASTLLTVAFTDYEVEALPSVDRLVAGDAHGFLAELPSYGGSLILRAPVALAAHATGAGELGVYRALAAPCLLAGLVFGLLLWQRLRGPAGPVAAAVALAVVVANPVLLPALDMGHPEEYLGAVLCATAVVAALADRPVLAGLLLGVAGANKAWAILAAPAVLLALGHGRVRCLAVAGAVCGVVLAPAVLTGSAAVASAKGVAHQAGSIFQPWQWSWFAGHHGGEVRGLYGDKPGYRNPPGWLGPLGHLPVVLVPLAISALAALRRTGREQALLLLALCLLLRCVLDPWDTAYYHLPFLMALAAHEVVVRGRAPVLAVAASLAVYATTVLTRDSMSADGQAALYLLWSLPTVVALGVAVLAPRLAHRGGRAVAQRATAGLPALSRALGVAAAPPLS